jgi:ribosome-binding factor A
MCWGAIWPAAKSKFCEVLILIPEFTMTVAGHRHERIAEEIRHEVSILLTGELKDPRIEGLATVTEVRVTPDLRQVRVFVSVLGTEEEQASTLKGLKAASGFVRRELIQRLRLRRGPELFWILDKSEEYGEHIDELLRKVKKDES